MNEFGKYLLANDSENIEGVTFETADFYRTGQIIPVKKEFTECTFIDGVQLSIPDAMMTFVRCVFMNKTNTFDFSGGRNLEFVECTFESDISIKSVSNVVFTNVKVNGQIKFSGGKSGNVKFLSVGDANMRGMHIKKILIDHNIIDKIELSGVRVQELYFRGTVSDVIKISGGYYDKIELNEDIVLNTFIASGDQADLNKLIISNLTGKLIQIKDRFSISNAKINTLQLESVNVLNPHNVSFSNVEVIQNFVLTQVDLSGVGFNIIDFKKAHLYLDGSTVSLARFSNIVWPKGHTVSSFLPEKTKTDRVHRYKVIGEVYRQLKKNSLGASDNISALKFYRNEMDTYWKRIKIDKSESWSNRVLICITKFSSNFGQSYWYPIWWLFGGHLVFCLSIWINEGAISCSEPAFYSGLAQYFMWLLPVYKTPENWSDISLILGVFMRIYNGFFIYHFIRATRKFARV